MSEQDAPPAQPALYQFPPDILDRWIAVPPDQPVGASLTKRDMENMMLGLLRMCDALAAMRETVVLLSKNEVPAANEALGRFDMTAIETTDRLRQFIGAIMAGAVVGDGMEPRIAVLEAHVQHLQTDVTEIKSDVKSARSDITELRVSIATLTERVTQLPGKGFIVKVVMAILTLFAALVLFADKLKSLLH